MHEGLVERVFRADGPNQLWLTDISERWTREGEHYICAVKDVYSNRIVGYFIDSRMRSWLAVAAVSNAVAMRRSAGADVAGCVAPAIEDRNSFPGNWRHTLTSHGLVGSMGRVASAGDNAAMESFFRSPAAQCLGTSALGHARGPPDRDGDLDRRTITAVVGKPGWAD